MKLHTDLTTLKESNKERVNITLDKKSFRKFKVAVKEIGLNASKVFNEFMNRVLDVAESDGGEVAFIMNKEDAIKIQKKLKEMENSK